MKTAPASGIRIVTTQSTTLVAICKKCGKKLGGGFGDGGGMSLAKALKKHLGLPKWKRSPVRIVETGCMKLCPKRAVAVTTSGDARLVFVVPGATPVSEVATRLGLVGALTNLDRHPREGGDPSTPSVQADGSPPSRG